MISSRRFGLRLFCFLFVLVLFSLTGCISNGSTHSSDASSDTSSSSDTEITAESGSEISGVLSDESVVPTAYTFNDDLGREVTVPSIEKTAALLGSYADIWILAGGQVCASADDAWEDFDLPLGENAVNLGATKKLSFEKLLACDPDLVLASTNTAQHLEWQSSLEEAGIPVAYFNVNGFDDYLRMLKICTDLTGQDAVYEQYGTALEAQIQNILDRSKNKESKKVLLLRCSASFIRVKNSEDTVLGQMLRDFGCENIADSDSSLLENLSIESIALQDPDLIFIIPSGDDEEGMKKAIQEMLDSNPLWSELTAMKNDHLYYMDKKLYSFKPNAKWALAYEQLESLLYE